MHACPPDSVDSQCYTRSLSINLFHHDNFDFLWICRTTCCRASAVRQINNRSKANRSPRQVVEQTASLTTSCTTSSKSHNKLDNLSHSKSTTEVRSKLHATISKSYSKSHDLLYDKSTTSRSSGVGHSAACMRVHRAERQRLMHCRLNAADSR